MANPFLLKSPDVIEGIGPQTAESLKAVGIETLAEMIWHGAAVVHRVVRRTASFGQVQKWISSALLFQVEGVDPDIAEALVDGGIASVRELADAGLQSLEQALKRAHESGKIRETPSLYRLAAIQRDAGKLRDTGMFFGKVVDAGSGAPLAGLTLRASRHVAQSDGRGLFEFVGLPGGKWPLSVEMAGRRVASLRISVTPGSLGGPLILRVAMRSAAEPSPNVVRESEGRLVWLARGSTLRLVKSELHDLPTDTYFSVGQFMHSGAVRLLHLYRTRIGREVRAEHVDLAASQLPAGLKIGDVLHYKDGSFSQTDLTLRDVATKKLAAIVNPNLLTFKKRLVKSGPRERRGEDDA